MSTLERRMRKIERAAGSLPCTNPEHRELSIFFYGVTSEQDLENDRKLKSIAQCEHCSKKENQRVNFIIRRGDFYQPPDMKPKDEPLEFDINVGEAVENGNGYQPLTINFSDWATERKDN